MFFMSIDWVIEFAHLGKNMIGKRRTKLTNIEKEDPPGPQIRPALNTVTLTVRLRKTFSTSRRLRK